MGYRFSSIPILSEETKLKLEEKRIKYGHNLDVWSQICAGCLKQSYGNYENLYENDGVKILEILKINELMHCKTVENIKRKTTHEINAYSGRGKVTYD